MSNPIEINEKEIENKLHRQLNVSFGEDRLSFENPD